MKFSESIFMMILLWPLCALTFIYSQNHNSVPSKEKRQLQYITQSIEETEKLLLEAKKNKVSSLKQMELMNSQISYRNELLATMQEEMENYKNEIKEANEILGSHQDNHLKIQHEYVQLLKKKLLHKLTFNPFLSLMNSENIETQVKRWYIIQWVEKKMLNSLQTLESSKQSLKLRHWDLKLKTLKQDSLIHASKEEARCLQEDIKNVKDMAHNFQNLESSLLKELITYKKKKEEMSQIISGSIKSLSLVSGKDNVKKAELKLTFPVDFPIITSRFGKNMESGNPNLVIRNNGIDLQSSSPFVKASDQAEVVQIRKLPTNEYLVITKSGSYYLVYSNLQSVLLKEGEKLMKNATIGKSNVNDNGAHEMHFEVWEGSKPINPLKFLK